MAPAAFADYAYHCIILTMAAVYFLAMAIPICLVLVYNLDRKTEVTKLDHLMASVNTKHRWPDALEWSLARKKIISRAKKKAEHKAPDIHLVLCREEWSLSTNVVNLDKFNWFLLGLGANYIAALLHQMILLQCMTGWSVNLAKATYTYFMRRPRKPPKLYNRGL
jgi:hypothetical protein